MTSTGAPTPSLKEIGALPGGVTFNDNGNGTATLSGTPASGSGGSYPLAFTASNGVGTPANQGFTLLGEPGAGDHQSQQHDMRHRIVVQLHGDGLRFSRVDVQRKRRLAAGHELRHEHRRSLWRARLDGRLSGDAGRHQWRVPPAAQNFTLTVNTVSTGVRPLVGRVVRYRCQSVHRELALPLVRSGDFGDLANGEVVVLDSAGYGPATITKPIAIVSPSGVQAGVSVASGAGMVVNAGAGGRVVLRGLTINALGGAIGVDFQSGAALYIERTTITNFGTAGLNSASSAGGAVYLRDVKLRDNAIGAVFGPTPASTGALVVEIDRADFENNVVAMSFAGKNTSGVVRGSTINGGMAGVVVQPTVAGSTARIEVRNSTVSKTTSVAMQAGSGADGASASVTLVGVQLTGSGTGLSVQAGGALFVTDSTVSRNGTGISLAGGTVTSIGDNRIVDNVVDGAFSSTVGKQ